VGILGSWKGEVRCSHHVQDGRRKQVAEVASWTPPTWIRNLGEP
jgi:hypothetical protein